MNPYLDPSPTRTQLAAQARESARWYAEAAKPTPAFLPMVESMEREALHQESMGRVEAGMITLKGES